MCKGSIGWASAHADYLPPFFGTTPVYLIGSPCHSELVEESIEPPAPHHPANLRFTIQNSMFDIRVSRRAVPLVRPVQLVQPVRSVRPLSISPHPPHHPWLPRNFTLGVFPCHPERSAAKSRGLLEIVIASLLNPSIHSFRLYLEGVAKFPNQ
jgi:hypothetical protein